MRTVAVINAKGGSGKTTLAINLAAYYANAGFRTSIMDYDAQSSSLEWLAQRPDDRPAIHGVDARPGAQPTITRSWQLRMPAGVQRVVIDTPAGMDRRQMQDMTRQADVLLVPILPSPVDIRAAEHFVAELMGGGRAQQHGKRIGVVANRVRGRPDMFLQLRRALDAMGVPLIALLRDSVVYMRAAEQGLGVCELGRVATTRDRQHWRGLMRWLEYGGDSANEPAHADPGRGPEAQGPRTRPDEYR